jgi:hypothetical protein
MYSDQKFVVVVVVVVIFHLFLELLLLWQKNALIGRLGSTLIFKDPLIILQFVALPNHLTCL